MIYGKVQGVGFRKFLRRTAEKLEVTGYVKNLEDGNVLSFASGEEDSLEKFFEICKSGPERAEVKLVEINKVDKTWFENFEIR